MKIVSYIRVSTQSQSRSGLGLEAQEYAVSHFLKAGQHELTASFREVESGKCNDRPELRKALDLCLETGATLVIAKLDRLSRNAAFLLTLQESGIEFVCCDCPNADKFTVGILALVAQREREMISQRTREGLAAAKRRGVKLGNPRWQGAVAAMAKSRTKRSLEYRSKLLPVIGELRRAKVETITGIAECLNIRGYKSPNGCAILPQTVSAMTRTASDETV